MLNRLKVMWGELPLFSIGDLAKEKYFNIFQGIFVGNCIMNVQLMKRWKKKHMNKL
jgi:hypothetical protein